MPNYGINAPQYQALDPDKMQTGLAQIAYGGNPIAAGLALSGENMLKDVRDNQYLEQLRQSNAMAASLADRGMANDRAIAGIQYYDPAKLNPVTMNAVGFGASPEEANALTLAGISDHFSNTKVARQKNVADALQNTGQAYNSGLLGAVEDMLKDMGKSARVGMRPAELNVLASAAGNAGQYQQTNTETGSAIPVVDPTLPPIEKKRVADAIIARFGYKPDSYEADVVSGKIKDDRKYTNQSKDKNAPPPGSGDKTKPPPPPPPPPVSGQLPPALQAERARGNLQFSKEANVWRNKTTGQLYDASGKPL